MELEIKFHAKFNVGVNESFYNRAKQTSTGFDRTGIPGPIHTLEARAKQSAAKLGAKNPNFGINFSKEYRQNMSNILKSVPKTLEWNANVAKSKTGTRAINNGVTHIMAKGALLESYLSNGWTYGRIKK